MGDPAKNLDHGAPGRLSGLLAEMTTAEKVSLLAGSSVWETTPVARLGVPAIKVSDGPNGARGAGGFVGGGPTSACFPAAIALAATWNPALIERVGAALGREAKSKGASLLLGPTVNIHRSPLNGRNFDCFSEDPFLSARIAVAYILELQREGVGATVKHFVGNDSEFQRNTISSDIDERTLREIYLPPFEAAVREGGGWAVMAGYNRVNGTYVGDSRELLTGLLKDEWGFDGVVMSDWFGTQSVAEAAEAGLDLEMPGPPVWRGARLADAVGRGEVGMAAIDDAAARILRLIERAGAFARPGIPAEQAVDRAEDRAVARRAAAEGIVLLKNEGGALPLDPSMLASIAIIGPNARNPTIPGGGSAQVNSYYVVTPEAGIAARAGTRVRIGLERGASNHRYLPRLDPASIAGGVFEIAYFTSPDLGGEPAGRDRSPSSEHIWLGSIVPGVDPGAFSARLSTTFVPETGGRHQFSLMSAGLSRLAIDGRALIDNWTRQTPGDSYFGMGSTEAIAEIDLIAGRPYGINVEYGSGDAPLKAVRLGHLPPFDPDAIGRAAALAAASDVALVFVGTTSDWESEGGDRTTIALPGDQDALIERVAAANPRTIVVLQTGSPVAMPWLDRVAGVVQMWFAGQECGNAIADVLFGDLDPSGRLTQTFPLRLEDNPAHGNYPGDNGHVRYGEGVFVGYRHYEKTRVAPLFPFGFGLSYTTFALGDARLSAAEIAPGDPLTVSVDVTNTGARAGRTVVQLYIRDPAASVPRPDKELKGFAKVSLKPGETTTVTLPIDTRALAWWDAAAHAWTAEFGQYEAIFGLSSIDLATPAAFTLTKTNVFGGAGT
ncbi:MAG: glycoside hydrolase family 3 C-terminal domain-containing protein [Thermomicrobiales bacterium]